MTDESGTWPNWAKVVVGAAATVAAVAVTVATGGAALPVIASVAASTVGGAVTGYIKGGKQGAIDGAANGFMMGGISALAGAAVGAIKTVGSYKKTIDTYSSLTKQYYIYQMPEKEAEQRNEYEEQIVEEYLKESVDEEKDEGISKPEYQYSDTNSYNYKGTVDSILVMDKINLKKVVIRGHQLSDNDYNLSKYYFVTQDLETTLNGNYIIFGHSLQTYGHSFNRLDEIVVTDEFYLI